MGSWTPYIHIQNGRGHESTREVLMLDKTSRGEQGDLGRSVLEPQVRCMCVGGQEERRNVLEKCNEDHDPALDFGGIRQT